MEEKSRESDTAETIGMEPKKTAYVVTRGFGEHDLLDLYTDYVADKVREDMQKKKTEQAQAKTLPKGKEEKNRKRRDLTLSR